MRALYRYRNEAEKAAAESGKTTYKSTCDCWDDIDDIMDADLQRAGVSGETNCLRSDDGDVFAWWEEAE